MKRTKLKSIGVDILGFLLIIAAGLTGWLPGPGGIPLLILGLSLLATNHEWAEKLLQSVKHQGVTISNKLFSDKPVVRWGIDIAGVLLVTISVLVLTHVTRNIARTAAVSLIIVSLFLLLGNRKRINSVKKRFQKK